ncbi:MAG: XRE family transcriptional regulator [Actinobacteria bacterium]|nr:MAG: XRE family transcriptional regulator [Actinomycetota bacterium]
MPRQFRNVVANWSDDVATWPYEALVACIEHGLVADWQPIFAEIRQQPWGDVARRAEQYSASGDDSAAACLFGLAVRRAREDAERRDREAVAQRVRAAIAGSGLTAAAFAMQVGTSGSRLSTYATGRVTPSAAMMLRIERAGGSVGP